MDTDTLILLVVMVICCSVLFASLLYTPTTAHHPTQATEHGESRESSGPTSFPNTIPDHQGSANPSQLSLEQLELQLEHQRSMEQLNHQMDMDKRKHAQERRQALMANQPAGPSRLEPLPLVKPLGNVVPLPIAQRERHQFNRNIHDKQLTNSHEVTMLKLNLRRERDQLDGQQELNRQARMDREASEQAALAKQNSEQNHEERESKRQLEQQRFQTKQEQTTQRETALLEADQAKQNAQLEHDLQRERIHLEGERVRLEHNHSQTKVLTETVVSALPTFNSAIKAVTSKEVLDRLLPQQAGNASTSSSSKSSKSYSSTSRRRFTTKKAAKAPKAKARFQDPEAD